MTERTAVVDDIAMRWLDHGEGNPVVFVHGIPTSPQLWRHVLPHMNGARCLAWEMVGYGAGMPTVSDHDISVARQADYLNAWLTALGIERAIIVGHDLGGGVAQIFAAHHPERISGLVLINSIAYDSWPIPSVKAMRRAPRLLHRLPNAAIYPMFVSLLRRGHDTKAMARESIAVHWDHYSSHGAARSLLTQAAALDTHDTMNVASRLPQFQFASAVIWGAADQFQKLSYGKRLARDLDAPLHQIDGGRHFVPEDHPERVASVVNDLLNTAPS